MRIGIDCRVLGEKGHAGIAQYTKHLVSHLLKHDTQNDYVLFLSEPLYAKDNCPRNVEQKMWRGSFPFISSHILFSRLVDSSTLDVFHSPSGLLPFFLKTRALLTVHDLFLLNHPEWFKKGTWLLRNVFIPYSIKKADRIISVSQATENSLSQLFPGAQSKSTVVHEGVITNKQEYSSDEYDEYKVKYRQLKEEEIVLFVGTIEPRKNIAFLLDTFERLRKKKPSVQLVIAGKQGARSEKLVQRIKNTEGVLYVGYISEQEKHYLLNRAAVFAWPSLDEGFGLPPLEALCSGVAVIASDCGATKEVLGTEGVVYIDTKDSDSLLNALETVLNTPVEKIESSRCALLSWTNTAKKTLQIYLFYDQKRRS